VFDTLIVLLVAVISIGICFGFFILLPQMVVNGKLFYRERELDKAGRLSWSQDGLGEY
jgi:hypothetical protein